MSVKIIKQSFAELWQQVTKSRGRKPSPMMLEVAKVLPKAIAGAANANSFRFLDSVKKLADRIAKHVSFQVTGTAFFPKVKCEWLVHHGDLELWSDLCLFGERDYFGESWKYPSRELYKAIKNARIWQCYRRYLKAGRVTNEHRILLRHLIWDQSVGRDHGAILYVEGKRPMGDSGIDSQIGHLLGWQWPEDDDMPTKMVERAWELFDELRFAIHDVILAGTADD